MLWDLDLQAAFTFLLTAGPSIKGAKGQAQSVFSKDVEPSKLVHATAIERLDLIGADASLRGLNLFHELDKEYDRMLLVMRAADLTLYR